MKMDTQAASPPPHPILSPILKNPEKSLLENGQLIQNIKKIDRLKKSNRKILKNPELIENIKAIKIHDPGNMLKILKLRS